MSSKSPEPRDPVKNMVQILQDALTFGVPVITEDGVGPGIPVSTVGGAGAASAPPTTRQIDSAIKRYLGRSASLTSPDAVPQMLSGAFTETLVRGHFEYTPRRPGPGQPASTGDGSASPQLTGTSAVIYGFAQSTVQQCKDRVNNFEPLIVVFEEVVQTTKDVVLDDLDGLLESFANEEIIPERVDLAFDQLGITSDEPEAGLTRDLAVLRDTLGISRANIKTVKDERVWTEFRVMIDALAALKGSWQTYRQFFTADIDGASLSRKIFLLERWQGVAMERMEALNTVLEQAGLDPASVELELQVGTASTPPTGRTGTGTGPGPKPKTPPTPTTRVFLSDLLGWTRDVLVEGLVMPPDAEEVGVGQARALQERIARISSLVSAAAGVHGSDVSTADGRAPAEYRWVRIQTALSDLSAALSQVQRVTSSISGAAFTITSVWVTPLGGQLGVHLTPSITGPTTVVESLYSVVVHGNRLPDDPRVFVEFPDASTASNKVHSFPVTITSNSAEMIQGSCAVPKRSNAAANASHVHVSDRYGAPQTFPK